MENLLRANRPTFTDEAIALNTITSQPLPFWLPQCLLFLGKTRIPLYRSGNARSPRLNALRTTFTHPKNYSFDFPSYKVGDKVFVSSDALAEPTQQRLGPPPYGMSVFSTPFHAEHLWKLPVDAQVPHEIAVRQAGHNYYRIGFYSTLPYERAVEYLQKFGTSPPWEKVPQEDIPPPSEDLLAWSKNMDYPLISAVERYLSHLKEKLAIAQEDEAAEIYEEIHKVIMSCNSASQIYSDRMYFKPTTFWGHTDQKRHVSTSRHALHLLYRNPVLRGIIFDQIQFLNQQLSTCDEDRAAEIHEVIAHFQAMMKS